MNAPQHMAHLAGLLAPPFSWHWWPHVEQRAATIAAEHAGEEGFAELPARIRAEYARLRAEAAQ